MVMRLTTRQRYMRRSLRAYIALPLVLVLAFPSGLAGKWLCPDGRPCPTCPSARRRQLLIVPLIIMGVALAHADPISPQQAERPKVVEQKSRPQAAVPQ